MIYLKTSVGLELRGEDMLISSLQSNFSSGSFTHFKRITGFRLREKEDLRREVQSFFKSNGLNKDSIILGIPRQDLVLRLLDLPVEVADNLKQVVQYQVQSFEPTEEDRFYYDYAPVGKNGAQKRLTVLLVMVKKALLDGHLQFLLELGIRPVTITGATIALCNLFLQNRKELNDKTFILADIAQTRMELAAIQHGTLVYSREATKLENQSWSELILREIDDAASKLRLGPEGTLEKVILAGENSAVAFQDLKPVLTDCDLLKSSIPFAMPGDNGTHFQEAASSLGLAYTGMTRRPSIKMNLLPGELRVHQTRWAYVPAAILGTIIIVLLIALGFRQMIQDRDLSRELDSQIQALKAPVERVQNIRNQAEAMEKKIREVEGLLKKRDMNLEVLQELTNRLPADTFLSTYTYRDGTILINGSSASAPDLIPNLEKSPILKDVVQKGPIFKDPQTGKDRFSFEAKLER
jgi:Tfp pilus assembly protein PilN